MEIVRNSEVGTTFCQWNFQHLRIWQIVLVSP